MKSWQRQIREKLSVEESYSLFGNYWDDIDKSNPKIKEVERGIAETIILRYEWLGTLPVNYMKYVGLFYGGNIAGVACFTNVKFGGKYTIFGNEAWCLGRGACVHWCPEYGGSMLVNGACNLLFGKSEKPIVVVAYSDWDAGEIGTIYQACNWVYLGHRKTIEWRDRDGKRYDINTPAVRCVTGFQRKKDPSLRATKEMIAREKQKMIAEGFELVDGAIRGRYVSVFGVNNKKKRDLIKLLKSKSVQYPKRIAVEVSKEIRTITNG